jgi:transglutaminase-like putative cysteine protease
MSLRLIALLLLWAISAGAHESVYVITGEQLPVTVAANGYVQTVAPISEREVEVRVAAALGPIGSKGGYSEVSVSRTAKVPEHFSVPDSLQVRLRPHLTAWEAATRVLEWTTRRLSVDVTDRGDQDAASVLARGHGRCSGVANATAALLMAAGFEAVTVSGLLVADGEGVPHRWVACRLPGAGWVHTDPTLGLWVMTASHVAFADAVVHQPSLRVVTAGGDGIERLPRRAGVPLRPNLGADLVCRWMGEGVGSTAVATLTDEHGEIHRATLDPEGRFTALLPGRWRLVVTVGGLLVEDTDLELRPGQVHSFMVSPPTADREREAGS